MLKHGISTLFDCLYFTSDFVCASAMTLLGSAMTLLGSVLMLAASATMLAGSTLMLADSKINVAQFKNQCCSVQKLTLPPLLSLFAYIH